MSIDLATFRNVAQSSFFSSRDISIRGEGDNATARLGNFIFSAGKKANDAVMGAFKAALEKEYGALGTHAFDTVLTSRVGLHKSLRACDVKATLSKLQTLREMRFNGEIQRQLDTSPKICQLPGKLQAEIRKEVESAPFEGCDIASCKTPQDVAKMAGKRIDRAISKHGGANANIGNALGEREDVETEAKPDEPTGLRRLKTVMKGGETSVEDRVKSGAIGKGMRINNSAANPMLLEKLKTNGVEPGFIYRNDWSKEDTRGYMTEIPAGADRAAILKAGHAHRAGVSAAAEYLLQKAATLILAASEQGKTIGETNASENLKNLARALDGYFTAKPDIAALAAMDAKGNTRALVNEAKRELFVAIRDAVMGVKSTDEEYKASPVFKHFSDRHIMKLDYNENDRIYNYDASHAGSFQRPERILATRKPILAQYYRLDTAQGADDISANAVTEALANDLTRLSGVPSQELEIVRGQYSDGHPKIMLQAKFAQGYKDMEAGFIKDGRIVPPAGSEVESLGKYKAFFLLTADRDAVGKRGQNKGFADGRFFAIDPGHSLEGNGKYLEISDDFSFKDTCKFSTKPRFKNFSVFDDDTRFAKLQGLVKLRETAKSGAFDRLFADYRSAFNPEEEGISEAESAMRTKVVAEIDKKEAEFKEQLQKLLKVGAMQLELYDELAGTDIQEGAIENIANLEKLCSPTTWASKNGKVALKHLEVKPQTRIPWRAGYEGDNLVYHTDKRIPEKAREFLSFFAEASGVEFTQDAFGVSRLVIPKDKAAAFFASFNENKVAQLTHPDEHLARATGGDSLAASAKYEPFKAFVDKAPAKPALTSGQLPPELDIKDDAGHVVKLPKIHYEKMATTVCSGYHRPRSIDELKAQMAARIRRGNEIVRALLAGNVSRFEANQANMAALTIALHVAALKKGEFMYRGSFSVSDPDGNIARWLDTCPDVYLRTSTHARPMQALDVDGHLNMPRGCDIKEGMGGLVNGMRTFHYFSLPDANHLDTGGSGPRRRLFLKCETFGIFCSTAHFHPNKKAHALSEGMKPRSYRPGDIIESISHGASLVNSLFTDKEAKGIRKENMLESTKSVLNDTDRRLRQRGYSYLADILNIGEPGKGSGIRQVAINLDAVISNMPEDEQQRAEVVEILDDMMEGIERSIGKLSGEASQRMGNEIMLDPEDFA